MGFKKVKLHIASYIYDKLCWDFAYSEKGWCLIEGNWDNSEAK